MKISVVTTLYHSENYVYEFYQRCRDAIQEVSDSYEFVFVNDGSPDQSLNKVLAIQAQDNNVKVVDLSRNFGHHAAIMAGIKESCGERVFLLDVDLEEAPENLVAFWHKLNSQSDHDVVYGVQKQRQGSKIDRWLATVFSHFFRWISHVDIDNHVTICRLMTRRFVDSLLLFKETELVFVGLCKLTGYQQIAVEVQKNNKGSTTYTLAKKLALAVNYITSYSSRPLELVFYFGLLISLTSLMVAMVLVVLWSFFNHQVQGWTSIVLSIWFVGGCCMFSMGIMGTYLSKIFSEVKRRPSVIVRRLYSKNKE